MKYSSFASRWNVDLIEENYRNWGANPTSVNQSWQTFFEGFELGLDHKPGGEDDGSSALYKALAMHRDFAHVGATTNPLEREPDALQQVKQASDAAKNQKGAESISSFQGGKQITGPELVNELQKAYCGNIGYDIRHIENKEKRRWLTNRIEEKPGDYGFKPAEKIKILKKVYEAEIFERFLHTRYVGQKRFSLEGGESLIPALDAMARRCGDLGIKEALIGMAHRGRLNVLANVMNKSYQFIFNEFSGNYINETIQGDGDVKYHLGHSSLRATDNGERLSLYLANNPSHLEAVNPIVLGQARARQRIHYSEKRDQVLPILIHGDAAIAGQGIVYETFNMSKLSGYNVGGTLHIVVNNQIGFTTNPEQSRSTRYCTDIAKMQDAPVFHVNGDDPLAVVRAMDLALGYRQEFGEDVFIDLICYRKHGHNEADEPAFTQPLLYREIAKHKPVSHYISEQLIKEGVISKAETEEMQDEFTKKLDKIYDQARISRENHERRPVEVLAQPRYSFDPVNTSVSEALLTEVADKLTTVPEDFKANPKIKRQLEAKKKLFKETKAGIDWAFAESLAFGTLLCEGSPVRLSGQDSERGTFSHRHAAYYDLETRERHCALNDLQEGQARFCVHNSPLSEAAVLGFDYGYSLDFPQMLCMWEAQFGDFVNGAQIIIDQFIVSSESKWQRLSGIVLLLPHGYEGQGPEHSSGRMERFLESCGDENIQVCNLTTPAQYYHALRRQLKSKIIKPLVIMTPKSLLRLKACTSEVKDFTEGSAFQCILDDPKAPKKTERLILCSGKIYYDLLAYREEKKIKDTAIVRIEQLHPLDVKTLKRITKNYSKCGKVIWCQEEPRNMGSWRYLQGKLYDVFGYEHVYYSGRPEAASPAVGSLTLHKIEQDALVETTFHL